MSGLKKRAEKLYGWFEFRLGLGKEIKQAATHATPPGSSSWWYVFGSAATVLFVLQIVTGILLSLVYVPSAREAWNSLQYLNHDLALGWFLRAMHGWGSNFMVAVVLIHMAQVFMFGAYKFPRELTWMVGVLLLLLTLGMSFSGQVLRFDQDAYWGLGIGAAIMGRVPVIGGALVHFLLGAPIIGGATLSRFFTLHVFVIPGLLLGFIGLHLLMVLRLGITEWPMPGRLVRKSTYEKQYQKVLHTEGIPFVPDAAWRDALFAAAVLMAVMACAFFLGPFGPTGQPDPAIIQTAPQPDIPFLWIFAVLALLPPHLETPILFVAPVLIILGLLLLPLVAGQGEQHWSRRPVAVLMLIGIAVSLSLLTRIGSEEPWSPKMNAWSADPVPPKYLQYRSPLERQGALVFQNKQCRNCHSLDGIGGKRGPALDAIASRLTEDQLIRQVLQGGGNMPAYGKSLQPAQVTALVRFLTTLDGNRLPPARDASQRLTQNARAAAAPDHR